MPRFLMTALVVVGLTLLAGPATAAADTTKVRYGPFTVPAATSERPGTLERLRIGVRKPCRECFITKMTPNLTYADGSTANLSTGAMLHHVVLANQFRSDATCGSSWLGLAGERFFAAGNERTVAALPAGYGYRLRWWDSWNFIIELMNMRAAPQEVYVDVTFTHRPAWASLKRVRPVWLDIDQCGDSEYSIPAGFSDRHWDWNVNVPGDVVTMLGHVHGHGIAVEATNESRGGASICRSVAEPDPHDPHHVRAMSTCVGDPIASVSRGEVVRLHSEYHSPMEMHDVMGIMLAYIHPRG